jgi:hypothetical protein
VHPVLERGEIEFGLQVSDTETGPSAVMVDVVDVVEVTTVVWVDVVVVDWVEVRKVV